MNADHLRTYIINPILKHLGCYSREAVELLILTAAQESHMGTYLHQINGPALGIYQMEPRTHKDVWDNFLKYREDLAGKVKAFMTDYRHGANQMEGNLYYATVMARVFYLRFSEPLPDDLDGMAKYYKQYWNTPLGDATVEQAIENYERFT